MNKSFSAYLSITIFITVIFMTLFAVWSQITLLDKARKDKVTVYENVSNSIVEAHTNDFMRGNYYTFNNFVKALKDKDIILYAFVVGPDGAIKYSTDTFLQGKSKTNKQFSQLIQNLEGTEDTNKNVVERLIDTLLFRKLSEPIYRNAITLPDNSLVLVYFYQGGISNVNQIYLMNTILAITFILCGFLSAIAVANKFSEV